MIGIKSFISLSLLLITSSASILLNAQESAASRDVLIVLNKDDHRYWQFETTKGPLKAPVYPKGLLTVDVSGCVSIGFFIESDGTTSGYRILKSIVGDSSRGNMLSPRNRKNALALMAYSALENLKQIHFIPGPENVSNMRGFHQIPFSYSANANPLRGSCDIPDLGAFLKSGPVIKN